MFEQLKVRIRELEAECKRLTEENSDLHRQLNHYQSKTTSQPPHETSASPIDNHSPSDEKVKLFRQLFRGREDIYSVRWENPQKGTAGYAPAYHRNWGEVVPKEERQYLPVDDHVIHNHLSGKITMGAYAILEDDRCWFLAADFDKKSWQQDCLAFLNSCDALGVSASLERSRSGNGGHVWIFFREPIQSSLARKLGSAILTHAMESRPEMGLDSYDRFFPSQDTLPKGGFGNLIALPLQKIPRQQGGSVFIDRNLTPYADQWAYLGSVRKMTAFQIEGIVANVSGDLLGLRHRFEDGDKIEKPWELKPSEHFCLEPLDGILPEEVKAIRANLLFIEKSSLPPALINRIIRLAAFHNPEFYQAQAMKFSTFNIPRLVHRAEDFSEHIALPRGCLQDFQTLCEAHEIKVLTGDKRFEGEPLSVKFQGELRSDQKRAVRAVMKYDEGIICAATAFGKTVVAANIIARRKTNTLIIVHRRQLLDQWKARISTFLDIDPKEIGQIGGGKNKPTKKVDIAIIQSLNRKRAVKDIVADYGHVIVDECHHISASSFELVMRKVKARYILGLTATPERKDGHHPILFMQCGPIQFRMSARAQAKLRPFRYLVYPTPTGMRFDKMTASPSIHDLYQAISHNPRRNQLIAEGALSAIKEGRSPLVLTERTDHLGLLADLIRPHVKHTIILKGGMGVKQRRSINKQLELIPENEPRIILATGRYAGEGFDDARLDTLFLAMPISWKGTLQQYAGRLHRMHEGKQEVRIYDYVDDDAPMFASMFRKRLKGYSSMGYEIYDPEQEPLDLK